jgi:hypothetical protein
MANHSQPKIAASISLEPTTHSFSSSQAPKLNLTLLLDYHEPITIYADDLSPSLMITHGAFAIHYCSSGAEVKQTLRTLCRIPPPTKVSVNLDESLFYTLLPYTPLTLSSPFTRKPEGGKPRAAIDPEYLSDRSTRHGSCGVDGLEPGYDYLLSMATKPRIFWYCIRWWEYGIKDDVLHPNGATNELDARKVRFGPGPHQSIEVDTSSLRPIEFRCEE